MRTVFLMIAVLLVFPASLSAGVYKWTDENGRVHYGDKPVMGSREVKIRTTPSEQARSAAENEDGGESSGEEKPEEEISAEKAAQQCSMAKQQLDSYNAASKIVKRNKDGSQSVMTDDERSRLIAETSKRVDRYCR